MRPSFASIKAFVAVYEEHSFTAAATREHATQPGISQHIRQLEDLMGVQFFDRSKSRVDPTPAAHAYYNRCVAILKLHAEAVRETQQFRSDVEGEIRVGISPALSQTVVGDAVAKFTIEHPNVGIRLFEGYPDALTNMVLSEELDCAVTMAAPERAGIRREAFLSVPEVLISSRCSLFPHMRPVALKDCGPIKLVLPGGHYVRRHALDAYFVDAGADVVGVIEIDSVSASLSVVAHSDWLTVFPSLAVAHEAEADRFSIGIVDDPPITAELTLIQPSRSVLSPAATLFSRSLRKSSIALSRSFSARLRGDLSRRDGECSSPQPSP